jgi:predicted metal-binding protein
MKHKVTLTITSPDDVVRGIANGRSVSCRVGCPGFASCFWTLTRDSTAFESVRICGSTPEEVENLRAVGTRFPVPCLWSPGLFIHIKIVGCPGFASCFCSARPAVSFHLTRDSTAFESVRICGSTREEVKKSSAPQQRHGFPGASPSTPIQSPPHIFAKCVMTETTPLPILRRLCRSTLYRILVVYPNFTANPSAFRTFRSYPPRLPERPRPNLPQTKKPLRERQLQVVHGIGKRLPLGFAHQKMHVLGHDHIPVNIDAEFDAHVLQTGKEQVVGGGRLESRLAVIATESEKMRLTGVMISPQFAGHAQNLNPHGYGRL